MLTFHLLIHVTVLRTCRVSAEGLDPSDAALFMLNNASSLQSNIMSHTAATAWTQKLNQEIETWLSLLVRYQSDSLLEFCGLTRLLEGATSIIAAGKGPLATAGAGFDLLAVTNIMQVMR